MIVKKCISSSHFNKSVVHRQKTSWHIPWREFRRVMRTYHVSSKNRPILRTFPIHPLVLGRRAHHCILSSGQHCWGWALEVVNRWTAICPRSRFFRSPSIWIMRVPIQIQALVMVLRGERHSEWIVLISVSTNVYRVHTIPSVRGIDLRLKSREEPITFEGLILREVISRVIVSLSLRLGTDWKLIHIL